MRATVDGRMRGFIVAAFIAGFLGIVLLTTASVSAKHAQFPEWVNKSKSAGGSSCCGELDCVAVDNAAVLAMDVNSAQVQINDSTGSIFASRVVRQCPNEMPIPHVCAQKEEYVGSRPVPCTIKGPDGSVHFRVTHGCILCLLLIECGNPS